MHYMKILCLLKILLNNAHYTNFLTGSALSGEGMIAEITYIAVYLLGLFVGMIFAIIATET